MKNPEERIPLRERPVWEISDELTRILGQQLIAFAICERNPQIIGAMARGDVKPTDEVEETLRDLAEVTDVLLEEENGSEELVRATMLGMNPTLNDRSVVEMFHEGEGKRVVAVARQLVF